MGPRTPQGLYKERSCGFPGDKSLHLMFPSVLLLKSCKGEGSTYCGTQMLFSVSIAEHTKESWKATKAAGAQSRP